jgi:hypothetical protein
MRATTQRAFTGTPSPPCILDSQGEKGTPPLLANDHTTRPAVARMEVVAMGCRARRQRRVEEWVRCDERQ